MDREDDNDNSNNKSDKGDDRLCTCACLMGDFADYEAFRKHVIGKHLKSFKIKLTRLDLKSFNRIPNKENAFKLTKFDRNKISVDVRKRYNLDDFFIEIKRHRLSSDFKYKVVENKRRIEPVASACNSEAENVIPDVVYSAVEDSDDDGKAKKRKWPLLEVNTLFVKRRIESQLFRPTPAKKATPAPKIASKPPPALVVNGGKQKKLMTRGRRNAARQSARKYTTDSTEIDSSSSDDDVVHAPTTTTTTTHNPFSEHFMNPASSSSIAKRDGSYFFSSASCSVVSQRTVMTTCRTTNIPAARNPPARYRQPARTGPFTVFNHRTVTTSMSTAIGGRPPRPVGLSKSANAFNAAQICRQVTKTVTTYAGRGAVSQRTRPPQPKRPAPLPKATVPSKPDAVISLLSDSDSDRSAIEIVDCDLDPATSRNSDDNEVYILPT